MKSSQAKIFDFTLLKQKLSEQENVMMAFVFGSARYGEQIRPDSDVDIAIWLKNQPTLDERLFLLELCQETLQFDKIDLCFLNTTGTLLRFEALSGTKLVIRDTELYADFFSKTCRYYEDDMMRLERNRRIWHEIHRENEV
ncbi:MAG: nucleotidyltransferase domain-containing protein [Desulfobacteraceae bacterium]|nr:nucleotidyltransferase domain-containing protein [Desulfobacteraceae bacterium]